MAQFIEVTTQNNNKRLFNANEIISVADRGDNTASITLRIYSDDGIFEHSFDVKESYDNIRTQLDIPKSSIFGN